MEEESIVGRYWCHVCSQAVNPITEQEIKCPHCNNGIGITTDHVGEDNGGLPSSETPPTTEREQPSMWAPILFGMLAGNIRTGGAGPTVVIRLVTSLQESNGEEADRGSQRVIIINPSDHEGSNNFNFGDYFLGPGFGQLLQHLAENDPNRHGTPPAQKTAVEAMPTVPVEEKTTCTVCLDDIDVGESAREMPCKHRFHGDCILPWLELHSSCPVCRFQMPVEEESKDTGSRSSAEEGGGRRLSMPLLWPFGGLFSMSVSSSVESSESEGNSNSQSQEN